MASVGKTISELRSQRNRLKDEIERIDKAIAVLDALVRRPIEGKRSSAIVRRFSEAGRKRIAAAQRARWAKYRKNKAVA